MKRFRITKWALVANFAALALTIGWNRQLAAQPATDVGQDGMEILTRGPVHEAFAETVTFDPEPGLVIPKAPRPPIEEVAPNQRPQGANVAWIPGYWGWDDERNDFLWVSGIWRALPPGRQWIPGYWAQAEQGHQWTSGYWADAQMTEVQYLPEPPATVEAGPNVAAASADDHWLPGSWVWQQNRYAWRPGNWVSGHQDWQWVPDYYVWTPRGYVFVDGYWDYSVGQRGMLFAPVYFSTNVYSRQGFSYSPSTVINPLALASHLFLRPSYGHYYFGDYYAASYSNTGFFPGFFFQTSRFGYDPFFAHQLWQNRRDGSWGNRTQQTFRNFRDNENARPPRTWAAQNALTANAASPVNKAARVAVSLEDVSKNEESQLRLQPVDDAERARVAARGQEYRTFLGQRQKLEASATVTPTVSPGTPAVVPNTPTAVPSTSAGPTTAKFTRSPFVGTTAEQLDKDGAPPMRYEVLKPDLTVEPRQRAARGNARTTNGTPPAAGATNLQGETAVNPGQAVGRRGAATGQQRRGSRGANQTGAGAQSQGAAATQQQGASNGQQRGASSGQQRGDSKDNKQSESSGQQQSASTGQQQGSSSGQQRGGTSGQQQGASGGGQAQGASQSQSSSESKKSDKK